MNKLTILASVLALMVTGMSQASPFQDVPKGHWAYAAIQRAVDSGIIQGYKDKFFGDRPVKRYEMAVILDKLMMHAHKHGMPHGIEEDLAQLQREFANELAFIDARITALDSKLEDYMANNGGGNVSVMSKGGPASLTIGGSMRTRIQGQDTSLIAGAGGANTDFINLRTRLNFTFKVQEGTAFIEFQDSRRYGEEITGAGPTAFGDLRATDVLRAWYEHQPFHNKLWTVKVGRQFLNYGDGRLLSEFDWNNGGAAGNNQVFDGALISYQPRDDFQWDFHFFRVGDSAAGAGTTEAINADIDYAGTYAMWRKDHGIEEIDLFALYYKDNNAQGFNELLTGIGDKVVYTLGGRIAGNFGDSRWDYNGFAAFQDGEISGDDLSAWAYMATIGYNWSSRHKWRAEVEWSQASGDNSYDGGRDDFQNMFGDGYKWHGHFQTAFALPAGTRGNTYLASTATTNTLNTNNWTNLDDLKLGISFSPSAPHRVGLDWHNLSAQETIAGIGDDIGDEWDLHWTYKLNNNVSYALGYSYFDADFGTAGTTASDSADFGWASATYSF